MVIFNMDKISIIIKLRKLVINYKFRVIIGFIFFILISGIIPTSFLWVVYVIIIETYYNIAPMIMKEMPVISIIIFIFMLFYILGEIKSICKDIKFSNILIERELERLNDNIDSFNEDIKESINNLSDRINDLSDY